jgi:hypothetical protein
MVAMISTTAVATTVPRHGSGSPPQQTSMWVWHWRSASALLATASKHSVTRLLVWAGPGFTADATQLRNLRQLRQLAHAAGIQLDALGGDPSWVDHPEVARAWAEEVKRSGVFDRLHVDVEPHARADWDAERGRLSRSLVSLLALVRVVGLPVDVDIPAWYDQVRMPGGSSLAQAVLGTVASVTIMAYADSAQGVVGAAAPEMALAAKAHKPAWIGINTAAPGSDPPSTSYWGRSERVIARDVATVRRAGSESLCTTPRVLPPPTSAERGDGAWRLAPEQCPRGRVGCRGCIVRSCS